jgi:fused signal recognition particle receptor
MIRKITFVTLLMALFSLVLASAVLIDDVEIASWLPTPLLVNAGLALAVLITAIIGWRGKQNRVAILSSNLAVLTLLAGKFCILFLASDHHVLILRPILVAVLMLCDFFIFWILFRLYLRTQPQLKLNIVQTAPPTYLTLFATLVLFLQISLGIWVSVNSAGLVCTDFPLCKDALLQQADYQSGLDFLNGLMNDYAGKLSFNARVAVHWLHRIGGLVSFVILSLLMLSATSEQYVKPIRRAGLALSALLLVQISLGILTIKLSSPLWLDIAHNMMAAILMLPLIAIGFYSKHGFAETEQVVVEVKEAQVKVTKQPVSEATDPNYARLKSQLGKTRSGLGGILASLPFGKKAINEDLLEEIEEKLLLADIGIEATTEIIDKLTDNLDRQQLNDGDMLFAALKQDLLDMLIPVSRTLQIPKQDNPFVILVVGVNGVGKTTTIGKLAKKLQNQGHSVMLAAGDTFRAAAVEQLQVWGQRNDIHVVAQHTGADSASVIFDAFQSAKAKGINVLIADTAGRLHTKSHLMEELKKIKRIISKVDETAPHEVLLVLDAGTGQNALSQAKLFNEAVSLTGLALTKLDGTAKGGIIFALAKQLGVPIRYIGVGESIDDLQDFNAQNFVDALFVTDE